METQNLELEDFIREHWMVWSRRWSYFSSVRRGVVFLRIQTTRTKIKKEKRNHYAEKKVVVSKQRYIL